MNKELQVEIDMHSMDFAAQAEEKPTGLIAEFIDFLLHNSENCRLA